MDITKREPKFGIGDIVQVICADEYREVRGIKNAPGWLDSHHDLKYRYKLAGKYRTVKEKDLTLVCKWENRDDAKKYKSRYAVGAPLYITPREETQTDNP